MAEDESYLNKRGLTHFWENIDDLKQDKLTPGTNISITNNTISSSQPTATTNSLGVVQVGSGLAISSGGVLSATGGGTADDVAWGHITGTMADQTDLTTALAAKANSADLATVATSGDYDDLTDKPTIGDATLTIQKNGTSAGTFTANATSNKTINITVPTTAADVSALPASTKYGASIAVSINTTDYKVTTTLKDQDGNTLGTAQTIDLPLESVVVNGSYDSTNKKIVLTLQSGSTIDIPVGDLISGLQSEITSNNMLASDLVDDTNQTHKFMTSAEKTKLSGIAAGAEVNVQSDWDQTTTTADDYIKNKPTLATVATSGSYNDLSNKPTIPTVNNATLTIQKNGTNVQTFTANASSNVTADIVTDELQRKSDVRSSMRPSDANYPAKGTLHFTTIGALDTQTQSGGYADAFLMNSWTNDSGGRVNAIVATKQDDQKLYHYTGTFNGSSWSGKKEIAYTDAIPTKVSDLTNDSGFITSSDTVAKADQLTTARTIAISGGATGTATSFNGTSNISIPITNVKSAYVTWGGKDIVQSVSPDDMGCVDEFGHNKLAFLPAECIDVEYSTDGGTTWTDYGLTDAQKIAMVTTTGAQIGAGKSATITADNIADMRGRVRIACGTLARSGKIYTRLKKILINFSTNGATGTKIKMRYRTIANYLSDTDTWVDLGTHDIGGWSAWNSYPYTAGNFGGNMTNQTGQPGQIEFEFWGTGYNSSYNSRCALMDVRFIGETNWTTPSELARAGHLYTMDTSQSATFPANVKVTGSLQHGNYTYTLPNKNGTVAMTSDIPAAITVDSALSSTSENPVQNKVINTALSGKQASLSTAQLDAVNSGITATKVASYDAYASQIAEKADLSALDDKQDTLTAGDHIDITNDVISAVDYVHSENPVSVTSTTPTVTGSMIANGTITADKLATGATIQLTLSTTDIGEGAALAANTLYGVYQ